MQVKLNQKELATVVENMERNGEDTRELRSFLERTQQSLPGFPISPAEYIESKMKMAHVTKGENLICCICKNQVDTLFDGVCEVCFRNWALSTMKRGRAL